MNLLKLTILIRRHVRSVSDHGIILSDCKTTRNKKEKEVQLL